MDQILGEAIKLREVVKQIEANNLMKKLVERNPEGPQNNYQCAWSFDLLEEEKAVPFL